MRFTLMLIIALSLSLAIGVGIRHYYSQASHPLSNQIPPSSTSDWTTYESDACGFQLKYPPGYEIDARSLIDSRYEVTFIFRKADLNPFSLQVIDLSKYLPLTNTPTVDAY